MDFTTARTTAAVDGAVAGTFSRAGTNAIAAASVAVRPARASAVGRAAEAILTVAFTHTVTTRIAIGVVRRRAGGTAAAVGDSACRECVGATRNRVARVDGAGVTIVAIGRSVGAVPRP